LSETNSHQEESHSMNIRIPSFLRDVKLLFGFAVDHYGQAQPG